MQGDDDGTVERGSRSTNATQQAFLEAHEHAFCYFGGVFRKLRYDNLASAVKKILQGRQRVETERVIAFRSHWGFQSEYCNPARGNEKGGVEGELGWYRRTAGGIGRAASIAAFKIMPCGGMDKRVGLRWIPSWQSSC